MSSIPADIRALQYYLKPPTMRIDGGSVTFTDTKTARTATYAFLLLHTEIPKPPVWPLTCTVKEDGKPVTQITINLSSSPSVSVG